MGKYRDFPSQFSHPLLHTAQTDSMSGHPLRIKADTVVLNCNDNQVFAPVAGDPNAARFGVPGAVR
jgi:hypothetical protein